MTSPVNNNTPALPPNNEIEAMIKAAYEDVKPKTAFRKMMQKIRQPYAETGQEIRNLKPYQLQTLFTSMTSWIKDSTTATGHTGYKSPLTKVRVMWVAHDHCVDPGAVATIRDQLQVHANMVYHEILGFSMRHEPPINQIDWGLAVSNYRSIMLNPRPSKEEIMEYEQLRLAPGPKRQPLPPKPVPPFSRLKLRKRPLPPKPQPTCAATQNKRESVKRTAHNAPR